MMSRLREWENRERNTRDDFSQVIEDSPTQFNVYRIGTTGNSPGFDDDSPDYIYVKKIVAKISLKNETSYRKISSDGIKGNEFDYIAITFDNDVRIGDKWEDNGIYYKVTTVNTGNLGEGCEVEVLLRRLSDES